MVYLVQSRMIQFHYKLQSTKVEARNSKLFNQMRQLNFLYSILRRISIAAERKKKIVAPPDGK